MRLASCVALELSLGVTLVAAAGGVVLWGADELRSFWRQEAHAAATSEPISYRSLEEARLSPASKRVGLFHGIADDVLLSPLRDSRIESVKFNTGGTSISLRMDFESGARAAFKPRQLNFQSRPRREVAAFRLNRLLGLSSVAPAIGRRFPVNEILERLQPESLYFLPRLQAEMIVEDGFVVGELSWWIPVIKTPKIDGYIVDEADGIAAWSRYLTVGAEIPDAHRNLLAQVSDMLLFDLLINNLDRWSGRNVRVSADGSLLYFMDNTLAFGPDRNGHVKVRTYLQNCQKFSRSLVARLRALRPEDVRRAVSEDLGPFDFLLSRREIRAVVARRDVALAHVDELIDLHGEQAVLVFP